MLSCSYWTIFSRGKLSNLEYLELAGSMSGTIPTELYVSLCGAVNAIPTRKHCRRHLACFWVVIA
jgi:hypothetical protein